MGLQYSKAQIKSDTNNQPNLTSVSQAQGSEFDSAMSRIIANGSPTTGNRTLDKLILTYLRNLSSVGENESAQLDNNSRARVGVIASLDDTVCITISCLNLLNPKVTVKFDSITVNDDHDHQWFPFPHPSDCCSGEWLLHVYVQGQGIDLTKASSNQLRDVDDGDTINFPPDTEVTIQMPNSQSPPLSIFTLGIEDDSGFINDCTWHGIPVPCGFCPRGTNDTAANEIFKTSPDTWFDAINELQHGKICDRDDRLGLINKIYYPPSWGEGVHSNVVSDTGDFILRYTISVTPGATIYDPGSNQCTVPTATTSVMSSPSQSTFPPTNAIDNNINTKWWSQNSLNPFITLDLGSPKPVCSVDIAWADGNTHPYKFTISVSNDGTNFNDIVSGISKGTTTNTEKYLLPQITTARYVKVTITQSIQGSINSIAQISEIHAFGM